MIAYQLIGPHLFREDAYREYCWSVDAYSAYQPASFIFLCFESFRDLLAEKGIILTKKQNNPNQEQFPWRYERETISSIKFYGLVSRIISDQSVNEIINYLEKGKNVLALLPNEIGALYGYMRGEDDIEKYKMYLTELGLEAFTDRLKPKLCNKGRIWWEEISVSKGRLFLSEDAFISDAYFIPGYGLSEENTTTLNALAYEFAKFNEPHLHISWGNTITSWVCHEPYTLHLQVRNFGPTLQDLRLEFAIPAQSAALSGLVFELREIAHGSIVSLAIQLEFRDIGKFSPIVNVTSSQHNGLPVEISMDVPLVEIMPSLRGLSVEHAPRDSMTLERFLKVARLANLVNFENIQEIARIDPEAAINKMRKAAEKIAFHILQKNRPKLKIRSLTFSDCIREIQSTGILSARSIGYFHTIRVIGNLASHPTENQLTDIDVRIVAFALAAVVEEIIERKYL